MICRIVAILATMALLASVIGVAAGDPAVVVDEHGRPAVSRDELRSAAETSTGSITQLDSGAFKFFNIEPVTALKWSFAHTTPAHERRYCTHDVSGERVRCNDKGHYMPHGDVVELEFSMFEHVSQSVVHHRYTLNADHTHFGDGMTMDLMDGDTLVSRRAPDVCIYQLRQDRDRDIRMQINSLDDMRELVDTRDVGAGVDGAGVPETDADKRARQHHISVMFVVDGVHYVIEHLDGDHMNDKHMVANGVAQVDGVDADADARLPLTRRQRRELRLASASGYVVWTTGVDGDQSVVPVPSASVSSSSQPQSRNPHHHLRHVRRRRTGRALLGLNVFDSSCYSGFTSPRSFAWSIIGDAGFVQAASGPNNIISQIVRDTSMWYSRQTNIHVSLKNAQLQRTETGERWNQGSRCRNGADAVYRSFSGWIAGQSNLLAHSSTWALISNCFKSGIVGMAGMSTGCSRRGGAGFGGFLGGATKTSWVFAHELGHNWGGNHSFERGQSRTGGIMDYGTDGIHQGVVQFNKPLRQREICRWIKGALSRGRQPCMSPHTGESTPITPGADPDTSGPPSNTDPGNDDGGTSSPPSTGSDCTHRNGSPGNCIEMTTCQAQGGRTERSRCQQFPSHSVLCCVRGGGTTTERPNTGGPPVRRPSSRGPFVWAMSSRTSRCVGCGSNAFASRPVLCVERKNGRMRRVTDNLCPSPRPSSSRVQCRSSQQCTSGSTSPRTGQQRPNPWSRFFGGRRQTTRRRQSTTVRRRRTSTTPRPTGFRRFFGRGGRRRLRALLNVDVATPAVAPAATPTTFGDPTADPIDDAEAAVNDAVVAALPKFEGDDGSDFTSALQRPCQAEGQCTTGAAGGNGNGDEPPADAAETDQCCRACERVDSDACRGSDRIIDAVALDTDANVHYVFRRDYYTLFASSTPRATLEQPPSVAWTTPEPGYPRASSTLAGFPAALHDGVDAVCSRPGGHAFFFKGTQVWKYVFGSGVSRGWPQSLTEFGLPPTWTRVSAAIGLETQCYLFDSEDSFVVYSFARIADNLEPVNHDEYPVPIDIFLAGLPVPPTRIDAAHSDMLDTVVLHKDGVSYHMTASDQRPVPPGVVTTPLSWAATTVVSDDDDDAAAATTTTTVPATAVNTCTVLNCAACSDDNTAVCAPRGCARGFKRVRNGRRCTRADAIVELLFDGDDDVDDARHIVSHTLTPEQWNVRGRVTAAVRTRASDMIVLKPIGAMRQFDILVVLRPAHGMVDAMTVFHTDGRASMSDHMGHTHLQLVPANVATNTTVTNVDGTVTTTVDDEYFVRFESGIVTITSRDTVRAGRYSTIGCGIDGGMLYVDVDGFRESQAFLQAAAPPQVEPVLTDNNPGVSTKIKFDHESMKVIRFDQWRLGSHLARSEVADGFVGELDSFLVRTRTGESTSLGDDTGDVDGASPSSSSSGKSPSSSSSGKTTTTSPGKSPSSSSAPPSNPTEDADLTVVIIILIVVIVIAVVMAIVFALRLRSLSSGSVGAGSGAGGGGRSDALMMQHMQVPSTPAGVQTFSTI